ncbi:MAG: 4-hydroxy-tetrahydrodipicolinate reductase [Ilumatobacteraceae bacterium]
MGSIRVGVVGATGRMGRTVCDAVVAAEGLELVALVDIHGSDTIHEIRVSSDLQSLVDASCDVVVDFTTAEAARETLPFLARNGIHAVVGTTGFDDRDLRSFESAFESSSANCLIAANFAISAVLMMRFAAEASALFETAEIIELHHDEKIDAPSGTALATAQMMAPSEHGWAADPTQVEEPAGVRGGVGPNGVRIHSVRMRGMTAHQEVILGAQGQTLTIRQDSYDRTSFMPGVVLGCRRISGAPGLTIGLDALL